MTQSVITTNVVIIGAGPVGLFAVFELGLLDMQAHLIDILDKPGGQCAELYPEKPIYDIPAFPVITGQQLTDNLMAQIAPFNPTFHFGQTADSLTPHGDGWLVTTSEGTQIAAKIVVIAAGGGSFTPKKPALPNIDAYQNVLYRIKRVRDWQDKRVVVAGGGDSALDWALTLQQNGAHVTLLHHRDGFRAAPHSVNAMRQAVAAQQMQLVIGTLDGLEGDAPHLTGVRVGTADGESVLPADALLPFYGLTMKLGPLANFGLQLHENLIPVDTEKFATSTPNIFAIGDINYYPGKLKLILSGFHEAALMARAAYDVVHAGKTFRFQYTTSSSALQRKLGVA